jgi:hypothetical protein
MTSLPLAGRGYNRGQKAAVVWQSPTTYPFLQNGICSQVLDMAHLCHTRASLIVEASPDFARFPY